MNSNNDNKEKFTEDNEGKFTEDGEIVSSAENTADVENAENNEEDNLLEITSGEIEYPEERVSLVDAIKYAFDMDEETSEERVVEDADDEVVFVAPDRIMNYIEYYLSHEDDEVESEETSSEELIPDGALYFSTAETDSLPPVCVDGDTDETAADADDSEEISDDLNAETAFEADEDDLTDETEQTAEEEALEAEDASDDAEMTEIIEQDSSEELSGELEVNAESEQEPSENAESDEETEEIVEEIEDEEAVEGGVEELLDGENDEPSDEDEVDLFEMADIAAEPQDDLVAEDQDLDEDADIEAVQENNEEDEDIPEIFTQGSAAAISSPETADDDAGELDEEKSEEAYEPGSEDEANAPAITVHRHRNNDADYGSDESDIGEYEEMFGSEETFDETEAKQTFFQRHSLSAWAKKKTAGGWTKFALKCVGVLLLVLCITAVLYVNGKLDLINYKDANDFEQYYNLSDTDYVSSSDEVYEDPLHYNSSTTLEGFDESMIDIDKDDVINVLLIGTDVRGGTYDDRGNTDSMILLSINTRDKNIKLTSFMRDLYVTIPGRGKNRLNAAYAYGGPQLLFDTLKENFDVDVDLYVRVNFANFRKIIDQVGGIEMELTQAEANYMNKYSEKYNTDPVKAGLQTLDGAQALSYARCRKIDSDFGRTERQRKVLIAFVDKIKSSSLTDLDNLLNTLLPMVQTNMPKMQILGLMVDALNYLNNDVETLNIPIKNSWKSVTIRQMSVLCPNFELNKTAIVAHIYSTYKLDVENTMYQSFEVPKGDTATKQQTTTTKAATTTLAPSIAEDTTTTTEPTESTQTSTTTKKTYWWEKTTTTASTTTPNQTTAATASKTQTTSSTTQNQSADDEAA